VKLLKLAVAAMAGLWAASVILPRDSVRTTAVPTPAAAPLSLPVQTAPSMATSATAIPIQAPLATGAQPPPTANASDQLSFSFSSDQFRLCWTKDAELANRSVLLKVTVDDWSNTARAVEVAGADVPRLADAGFRAFAERAVRAVARCPIPFPAELVGKVHVLMIRFTDGSRAAPVPSVADVQADMDMGFRDTGIALATQFCGLRSKHWVAIIQAGLQAILDRDSRRMSPGDFGRVLDRARPKQDAEVYRYFPNHCDTVPSGEIERLDRFETIVTGNYH